MKRLIPLAVIACVALAACGGSSHSSSSATTNPSATTTPGDTSAPSATGAPSAVANLNTGNPASRVILNEDGSSLLYPFLQELVTPLRTTYANISLSPAAGGSGKGISDAINGTVQMGGSDAYLSPGQMSANPGLQNIPIVVSAQAVNYNLPGIKNLKLTGNVLAEIYTGKITKWNDPAITALNPGVTLPATGIIPVRRVDSSGDTFLFTSFLDQTNTAWANGPAFGTTITWPPVASEVTAHGNPGMVQTCKATPGCVAYVGVSAEASAQAAGLGEAMLQNKSGAYLQPTAANITAAADAGATSMPANLAVSLIYQPGTTSYPIVNFEYIVVKDSQHRADVSKAIRTFLAWTQSSTGGSAPQYLAKANFVALPASTVPAIQAVIAKIGP